MRVAVVAFDGVDDLDFVGAYSVLAKSAEMDPHLDVFAVSPGCVRTAASLTLSHARPLSDLAGAGTVVVPGGRAAVERPCLELEAEIRSFPGDLHAVCSGAIILARAGRLDVPVVAIRADREPQLRMAGFGGAITSGVTHHGPVSTYGGLQPSRQLKAVVAALTVVARHSIELAEKVCRRIEIPTDVVPFRGAAS